MSTSEKSTPLETAPAPIAPANDAAAGASARESTSTRDDAVAAGEALSPAVRRLVRQFDLDITGVHGTGPSGRIRVGDLMGLLGGRTDSGNRDAPVAHEFAPPLEGDTDLDAADITLAEPAAAPPAVATAPTAATEPTGAPTTTVFDCNLSRVLSHRKRLRRDNVDVLLTSYFLAALAAALRVVPEVAGGGARLGALLATADGATRFALLDTALDHATPAEYLHTLDAELRARLDLGIDGSDLLVHHYGESGSLLATPTPIGAGHAASVGIGRVRREIVVRSADGVESPRVAARCYVSLSFFADRVAFERANAFLAHVVRMLEDWPE